MKLFVKFYEPILHGMCLIIFVGIFYIGGINLVTLDSSVLPLQILVLALNYPVMKFALKQSDLEKIISEYIENEKNHRKHE